MASLGAKVMQPNAVQAAMIEDIPISVKSTFSDNSGTKIVSENETDYKKVVTGIAYSKGNAKVSIVGVIDKPGVAAEVFEPIGKNNINIDMVIQNTSLDGKIIKIEQMEKENKEGQADMFRLKHQLSEGKTKTGLSERNEEGKWEAKDMIVDGYPVFISTTTNNEILIETINRLFLIELD